MNLSLFAAEKRYRCFLLDPPWAEKGGGQSPRGAQSKYPVVGKLGDIGPMLRVVRESGVWTPDENAHCWCWYTDTFLPDALALVRELGFTYKRTFQWVKVGVHADIDLEIAEYEAADLDAALAMGIGQYGRGCHEGMIFATRGQGQHESVWTGARDVRSVFHALVPRGEDGKRIHSRKPEKSYRLIDRVSCGRPRVELFARIARPEWDVWGNQAPEVA